MKESSPSFQIFGRVEVFNAETRETFKLEIFELWSPCVTWEFSERGQLLTLSPKEHQFPLCYWGAGIPPPQLKNSFIYHLYITSQNQGNYRGTSFRSAPKLIISLEKWHRNQIFKTNLKDLKNHLSPRNFPPFDQMSIFCKHPYF